YRDWSSDVCSSDLTCCLGSAHVKPCRELEYHLQARFKMIFPFSAGLYVGAAQTASSWLCCLRIEVAKKTWSECSMRGSMLSSNCRTKSRKNFRRRSGRCWRETSGFHLK